MAGWNRQKVYMNGNTRLSYQPKSILLHWFSVKYHNHGHLGPEYILSNIRTIYWILKKRSIIKKVGGRCILCQTKSTRNIQPKMNEWSTLRKIRTYETSSSTGINLFGPATIKEQRARLKHWGALFSCFTARAIHLEVVEGYDTDSFIGSLQRFVNREGKSGDVCSDCCTNLKETTSKLNIEIQRINEYLSKEQTTWHLNPLVAPHMGKILERIIRQ